MTRQELIELDELLKEGKCPHRPELYGHLPLGNYHCPICGTLVVAGIPHPKIYPPWTPEENKYCKELRDEIDRRNV